MACESWKGKLDAYFDGELSAADARALNEHLNQCASCSAEGLRRVQWKRTVQAAAHKFTPDAAFRARIQKQIASPARSSWSRRWIPAFAAATAVLIVGFLVVNFQQGRSGGQQLLGELTDQYVATLASANPVDVISTDRHTVKPWFEGKIPFTFNVPELQGSPFVLVGGKVSYLRQSSGAELIFRVRQHQISVFIFQEEKLGHVAVKANVHSALSFQVKTWQQNGLRFFVVSDAGSYDLDQLSELIKAAN
ncbi:MAG TPA: zf-HC2 domain-containing protein [Terriglobales bacterium]|jgi:anti-sigma factor RsiW